MGQKSPNLCDVIYELSLTSNVEIDRIADSVPFNVVSDAGVHAGLIPLHILQDQALVADDDAIHGTHSKGNVLKKHGKYCLEMSSV